MSRGRALAIALCLSLAPAPLAAQPDSSKRALTLGYEADGLYARGRWGEAYEKFAEADRLAHSPVFVLYMARCRKNAGRLIEARSIYDRVAGETLSATAPQPFRDAVSDAKTERGEVAAKIPSILVTVTGAATGEVTVKVDDEAVPMGKAVPLDPASHKVTAMAGDRRAEKTVALAEGAGTVPVELALAGKAAPASPAPAPTPVEEGSLAPAVVALSFGVIGIGVGAVTGVLASSKAGDVKDTCNDAGHCASSEAADLDSARTLATTSTIGFVAGGVGLAAALVLYLVRPGGGAAPKAAVGATARSPLLVVGTF